MAGRGRIRDDYRNPKRRACFVCLVEQTEIRRAVAPMGPHRVGKTMRLHHAGDIAHLLDGGDYDTEHTGKPTQERRAE